MRACGVGWRLVVAAAVAAAASSRLDERLHGDAMFDTKSFVDERSRVAEFGRRWGSWPPPALVAREQPSYTAAMAAREAEIMLLSDSQERWDAWMFLAQARLLANLTVPQWRVVDAPADIHAKLLAAFAGSLDAAVPERELSSSAHSGVSGANEPVFLQQEALNYEVLDALKPLHEAWAGVALEPTSVYGVRVYRDGATLADHLDVAETHVISSVLHVDSKLRSPFPLEIQDARGVYAGVDLRPGQMMFYESAKCFHRRSQPMAGDYYGSLFLHYRPREWTFSRTDVRVAIPPHWGDGLAGRANAASADAAVAAIDARGEAVAADARAPPRDVTFALGAAAPLGVTVELAWLDGERAHSLDVLDAAKTAVSISTFDGHAFRATPDDGSAPRTFVMADGQATFTVF